MSMSAGTYAGGALTYLLASVLGLSVSGSSLLLLLQSFPSSFLATFRVDYLGNSALACTKIIFSLVCAPASSLSADLWFMFCCE